MNTERRYPNLVVEDIDHVRVLRIDRESKLGALSSQLVDSLGLAINEVSQSDSVRTVVLTGTGRGFIAGADIAEYTAFTPTTFDAYQRRSRKVSDALEALPQITIAAVNGYAFGGGFEIALCCDLIIAGTSARFGLPEIKLGLVPGGGGPQRLSRLINTRFAKELTLTGRTMLPEEALHRGVINSVVEDDQLRAETLRLASELASLPQLALQATKRRIDNGLLEPLESALTQDRIALSKLYLTADAREGLAAFVEKRQAVFGDS